MKLIKKIVLATCLVFLALQFFQPAHNKSGQVLSTDFETIYMVAPKVRSILQNACYDCHSNNTKYPWYSNIQPLAWMMAKHIKQGKEKLNFSDFGSNTTRKQISKLKEMANQIKDEEMPISSYKMMHKAADLSKEQQTVLSKWLDETADSLSRIN